MLKLCGPGPQRLGPGSGQRLEASRQGQHLKSRCAPGGGGFWTWGKGGGVHLPVLSEMLLWKMLLIWGRGCRG